jgi:sigma-B regulation protein RsbU (phosphoserine phosphatase)
MHPEIAQAVGRLNEQLLQAGMMDRFVTLSASLLDPKNHKVAIASAGHESPLIYRRATHSIDEGIPHSMSGFPLGMIEGTEYEANTIELSPGDSVVVFTDGITDALNLQNASFGMEQVHAAVLGEEKLPDEQYTPQAIGKRVIAAMQKFTAGQFQNDDIALVCFGRLEQPLIVPSETWRVATTSGPMTQTMKKRPGQMDD